MGHRTPNQYEEFIASLVTELRRIYHVESIGFGKKNCLRGKSGVDHQIDVSFIDTSDATPALVVVECKNLNEKNAVKLGHVKILKATVDDLAGHPSHPSVVQGYLVSTTPAQSGAKTYAGFYGLSLQVVSAGPNWCFRYGRMLQVGLSFQAGCATVTGTAALSRKCSCCNEMFGPQGAEVVCPSCASSHGVA